MDNNNAQTDTHGEPMEYRLFVDKFKPKKTTDDCYTPPEVYEVIKQWVLEEVPQIRELRIVRPFYPGGDYKAEDYTGAVVIDNPPFSILAEIKRFYLDRGVPFFLFAPALTLLTTDSERLTSIVANCAITYQNGAVVSTSYTSNLFGDTALILAPELARRVKEAQKAAKAPNAQPRYEYPPNVVTGATLNKYIIRGISLRVPREEVHFTRALDSQRKAGKALYGSGFIVSDRVAKILQSAPKEPPKVLPKEPPKEPPTYWELSDREQEIIRQLNGETNRLTELDPPENFREHLKANQDRIACASRRGTLPYFVRDNYKVAHDGTLTPTFNAKSIEAQKLGTYGNKLGRKATQEAQTALADHKTLDNFSEAQMKNFEEINKATGYKRGKVMSFDEADNGQSNISRDTENCASCVVVHEMRLRGYDISTLKYDARDGSISKLLSEDTRSIWMTAKGKTPEFSALIGGEPDEIVKAIEKQTQPIGSRYHIGWDISKELGHVVTAERTANGLVIYDPQKNTFLSLEEVVSDMMSGSKIQLLRVDRLLLRSNFLRAISSTLK